MVARVESVSQIFADCTITGSTNSKLWASLKFDCELRVYCTVSTSGQYFSALMHRYPTNWTMKGLRLPPSRAYGAAPKHNGALLAKDSKILCGERQPSVVIFWENPKKKIPDTQEPRWLYCKDDAIYWTGKQESTPADSKWKTKASSQLIITQDYHVPPENPDGASEADVNNGKANYLTCSPGVTITKTLVGKNWTFTATRDPKNWKELLQTHKRNRRAHLGRADPELHDDSGRRISCREYRAGIDLELSFFSTWISDCIAHARHSPKITK